jgi:hypothetical protein
VKLLALEHLPHDEVGGDSIGGILPPHSGMWRQDATNTKNGKVL